tara:strand:+ start:204 stop:1079 length:876 start_codon:yes stop_codon:yes gene_type:complete
MGHIKYDLHEYEFVKVKFVCYKCGTRLITELINVPDLDNLEEYDGHIFRSNIDDKECPKCNNLHFIHVGFEKNEEGYIEIESVEPKNILDVIGYDYGIYVYDENYVDAILHSDNSFDRFKEEIHNLTELNSLSFEKDGHRNTVRKLIFSAGIACLEDYLSSTLIKEVIQDEIYFRNFVRTYKNITNRKFELGNIYEHLEKMYDVVKKELLDVIYHDLPKVKGMYKDTLGVIFPSIETLMKSIKTRHDIVHRNGKTKDGNLINLNKQDIEIHLKEINKFVCNIENQVRNMED